MPSTAVILSHSVVTTKIWTSVSPNTALTDQKCRIREPSHQMTHRLNSA